MSPTRITPTTKTLINVIITKEGDIKIIDSGVIHIVISDHSLVYRPMGGSRLMQLMRVHQSKFSHERELSTFYQNIFKYWLSLIQSL